MELVCKAAVHHQLLDAGKSTRVGSFGVDEAAQQRNKLSCLCKDAKKNAREHINGTACLCVDK